MRYCSEHANETVRLTKKVEVCGIIEDLEFELTNVPSGRISTNQNQSLNVFERKAVEKWNKDEDEILLKHGNEAGNEIIKYRRDYYSCFSPGMLEKQHGITKKVAQKISLSSNNASKTSTRLVDLLTSEKEASKKSRSSILSSKIKQRNNDQSSSSVSKMQTAKKRKSRTSIHNNIHPVIKPNTESPDEIKRRTGFVNEEAMMRYIVIVCNADMTLIEETTSNDLTWFEEWFLFFKVLWF